MSTCLLAGNASSIQNWLKRARVGPGESDGTAVLQPGGAYAWGGPPGSGSESFFLYGIMERRLACLSRALHLDTGHQTAWTGFGGSFW